MDLYLKLLKEGCIESQTKTDLPCGHTGGLITLNKEENLIEIHSGLGGTYDYAYKIPVPDSREKIETLLTILLNTLEVK